jgi:hypothetical protein
MAIVFHGHCCLFVKVLHHHRTKEVPVRCLQSVGGVWKGEDNPRSTQSSRKHFYRSVMIIVSLTYMYVIVGLSEFTLNYVMNCLINSKYLGVNINIITLNTCVFTRRKLALIL